MKAVILAAGMGTRLQPMTESLPKCLVSVQSRPILEYQLGALSEAGIRDVVLIVGYLSDLISGKYGSLYDDMRIHYVHNRQFDSTNNIYSLWEARQYLREDILLLEGDLIFDSQLLCRLTQSRHTNVAVVDEFQPPMNGTIIQAKGSWATRMVLGANQNENFDYSSALKTVNIYKFSGETLSGVILPLLDSYISQKRYDQYYEAVFADLIGDDRMQLAVLHAEPNKWAEVDTWEDLRLAEKLFAAESIPSEKTIR